MDPHIILNHIADHMKTICSLVIAFITLGSICLASTSSPTEFVTTNPDGSVKTKGKYTRNTEGRVIRFDVVDGQGKPLYSELPYYAEDGRIIRADRISPDGALKHVVVYLEDKAVILNASGKLVETQGFSQGDYLKKIKP
jgi:hypothetical protein